MTLSQERIEQLAEVYADVFAHSAHELGMLFQSKENRDAVWREAKKRGLILRRRTTGHQVLDPRYTVEDSHLPDRGLANESRSFGNLYELYVGPPKVPMRSPV